MEGGQKYTEGFFQEDIKKSHLMVVGRKGKRVLGTTKLQPSSTSHKTCS